MAQAVPDTLVGSILTFAAVAGEMTDGFAMEVTSINPELESGIIDTTHMGNPPAVAGTSFGGRTYMSAKLQPGTITVEGHFNADLIPPLVGDSGAMTLTYPLASGDVSAAKWEGDVHVESVSINGSVDPEDHMTISLTLRIAGLITFTAAA